MSNEEWVYHSPVFESDKLNPEMMIYSPWSDHRLFAYDLIVDQMPERVVELGSFYGCSSFAFLQAIKDNHSNSEFYAIDTWAGDGFTQNDYQEDIFSQYKQIQDVCFNEQKAYMLQMTFDDALDKFEDNSIDVLHIDGSHTYEDVSHDFYSWLSKVKSDGIILLHDVGKDLLDGKQLGSHFFWEELKERFSYTFEFPFSFGLGVLVLNEDKYNNLISRMNVQHYQEQANFSAVIFKDIIRKQYFQLKSANENITSLQKQVDICQTHLDRYEKNVNEKNEYISQLQKKNKLLTEEVAKSNDEITGLHIQQKTTIEAYEKTIKGKEEYINELEKTVEDYSSVTKTREIYITELETKVNGLTDTVRSQVNDISRINDEYSENIKKYIETDEAKNQFISELQEAITKFEKTVSEKEEYISELQQAINDYDSMVTGKEKYISELKEVIDKYKQTVDGKEKYIQELIVDIENHKVAIDKYEQDTSQLLSFHEADQHEIQYLNEQLKDCKLKYEVLSADMKKAMVNARDDEEMILRLQEELQDVSTQIVTLKQDILRLPFGRRLLKKMRVVV